MNIIARQIIDLLPSVDSPVISFVGAGGKTTAIYHLAEEYLARNRKVLFTTTTKIFHPKIDCRINYDLKVGESCLDSDKIISPETLVIAARYEDPQNQKLIGFSPRQIDEFAARKQFDIILVEADGAKQKPVKAPADHEPVIPGSTDVVIGVIGLDCIGKPLNEDHVHRSAVFSEITGTGPNEIIDSSACASLISSPRGLFKGTPRHSHKIVLLNKAEDAELEKQGRLIAEEVLHQEKETGLIDSIIICSFKSDQPLTPCS